MPERFVLLLLLAVLLTSIVTLHKLIVLQRASVPQETTSEVQLQVVGSRVCLSKEVDGVPVQYYCERKVGETAEQFGRRCRLEFQQFCQGFDTPK